MCLEVINSYATLLDRRFDEENDYLKNEINLNMKNLDQIETLLLGSVPSYR